MGIDRFLCDCGERISDLSGGLFAEDMEIIQKAFAYSQPIYLWFRDGVFAYASF